MTSASTARPLMTIARIAGFAYLFLVVGATLNWTFVFARLVDPADVAATAANVVANERLFRIGITYDVLMAVDVMVLAWTHYVLLERVNRRLALLGFTLRLADAILFAVPILFCLLALQLLNGEPYLAAFPREQLQALVGLFLKVRTPATVVPMVLTGLGSIVFLSLLFQSGYVPRWLSGFGVLAYVPVLAYSFVNLLVGRPPGELMGTVELLFYVPSILLEVGLGLWLLIKGVAPAAEGVAP